MRKDLGVLTAVFPMPVLMVASYDEAGTPDVMNAAWGMICDYDKVALFLAEDHQTTRNILNRKAFTVALADKPHEVSGMLLYAKTDEDVYPENEYRMSGNRIEVRTLNLDGDFSKIKAQLDGIAEKYLGVKAA